MAVSNQELLSQLSQLGSNQQFFVPPKMTAGEARDILKIMGTDPRAGAHSEVKKRFNLSDETINSVAEVTKFNFLDSANYAILAKRIGWDGKDYQSWFNTNKQRFFAFLDDGFPINDISKETSGIVRSVQDRGQAEHKGLISLVNKFEIGQTEAVQVAKVVLGQADASTLRGQSLLTALGPPPGVSSGLQDRTQLEGKLRTTLRQSNFVSEDEGFGSAQGRGGPVLARPLEGGGRTNRFALGDPRGDPDAEGGGGAGSGGTDGTTGTRGQGQQIPDVDAFGGEDLPPTGGGDGDGGGPNVPTWQDLGFDGPPAWYPKNMPPPAKAVRNPVSGKLEGWEFDELRFSRVFNNVALCCCCWPARRSRRLGEPQSGLVSEGLAKAWTGDGPHRDLLVELEREALRQGRGCLS